ncbi:MAG: hypothetical protein IPM88_12680 [Nitrospira sp.]|nr:hypothetical protein [Nitrospira sp.]
MMRTGIFWSHRVRWSSPIRTGREFDSESGLYYYRARYYDALMGRFLQKDPIGFGSGDSNFYRYVRTLRPGSTTHGD